MLKVRFELHHSTQHLCLLRRVRLPEVHDSSEPMGTKERKARLFQAREREILEVARELFLEHEFHLVSVDRIAERVEVSKGTIYNHFASKEEIFAQLMVEWREQMIAQVRKVPQAPPYLEALRQSMRVMIHFNLENPQAYQRFRLFEDYGATHAVSPSLREKLAQQEQVMHQGITRLLQGCMEEGSLPNQNTDSMYVLGKSLIVGISELLIHDRFSISALQDVDEFIDFALEHLLGCPLSRTPSGSAPA